jgi:hypothetical protein
MRKTIVLIIIISTFVISCKSNYTRIGDKNANYIPYYLKVYEADSLYIVGNHKRSFEILDGLFKKYEPINMQMYYEVFNYMKLKVILNKKTNRKELKSWIIKYGVSLSRLENDSLLSYYSTKNSKWLVKNYPKLREKFMTSINLDLREQINIMISQDQYYRNNNYQANIDKQNRIDSINSKKCINIFKQYGYPNDKIIGDFSIDKRVINFSTILLHTKDKERIDYFSPKVLEFIKKGQALPKVYANMYDQYLLYNGSEQYFGSYSNPTDVPIQELNIRRQNIGMPKYKYDEWRFKQLYPNEEY